MWLALLAPADAQDSTAFVARPVVGWAVAELRGGVSGGAGSVPLLCGELAPWRYVALEACGSGAGFLYPRDLDEIVHFRVEGTIPLFAAGRAELALQPGIEFAEVEHGADRPGFLFGPARSAEQREGAGPEANLGLKGRAWFHERAFATGELVGGAALVPSAPTVLQSDGVVVPFVTCTVGAGS